MIGQGAAVDEDHPALAVLFVGLGIVDILGDVEVAPGKAAGDVVEVGGRIGAIEADAAVRGDRSHQHGQGKVLGVDAGRQVFYLIGHETDRRRRDDARDIAQLGGDELAKGLLDRLGPVDDRAAVASEEPRDSGLAGARQVRVADGVEDDVVVRQDLVVAGVLHIPDVPGIELGRHEGAIGDIAMGAGGQDQHAGARRDRRLMEQGLGVIGPVEPGLCVGGPAGTLAERRQGLAGERFGGVEAERGVGRGFGQLGQAGAQVQRRQAAMRPGVAGIELQGATELPFGVVKPVEIGIGEGEVELRTGNLIIQRRRQLQPRQGGIGRSDRLDQLSLQALGRQGTRIQ